MKRGYLLQRLAGTHVTATEVCTVTTFVACTLDEAFRMARDEWPNSPIRDAETGRVFGRA